MYSPVIDEQLIPALYLTAKARGIHMTQLVDELVLAGLASRQDTPVAVRELLTTYKTKQPRRRKASC
jgi:hypothetical protein